jgi:hypothetical protein
MIGTAKDATDLYVTRAIISLSVAASPTRNLFT